MVELVLCHPGRMLLELESDVRARFVLAFDGDLHRSLDRDRHALQRQAAFRLAERHLGRADEHRVDDRPRLVFLGRLEHEQALEGADLGAREPHAARLLHQRGHPLDQPAQVLVETLDLVRAHPQDRVRVLPDLRQRQPPPRFALRVELLPFADLALLFNLLLCHAEQFRRGYKLCGSTSTTAVRPALRIAGAAAASSFPARPATRLGSSVLATS